MRGNAGDQRNLLQEDDGRNAEGESLDHRPRQIGHQGAQFRQRHRDDHDACQHRDNDHRADAELPDDGHQHHGHGAGRSGDLKPGATEDRRDHTRHYRGDQTGSRAHTGRNAETQGERQRDDTDRETGDEVPPQGPPGARVVGSTGQAHRRQPSQHVRRHDAERRSLGAALGLQVRKQVAAARKAAQQKRPGGSQEPGHRGIRQAVDDAGSVASADDHARPTQHREVGGQGRRLDSGIGQHLRDRGVRDCQQLQHPDPDGVPERLEQLGLEHRERLAAGQATGRGTRHSGTQHAGAHRTGTQRTGTRPFRGQWSGTRNAGA